MQYVVQRRKPSLYSDSFLVILVLLNFVISCLTAVRLLFLNLHEWMKPYTLCIRSSYFRKQLFVESPGPVTRSVWRTFSRRLSCIRNRSVGRLMSPQWRHCTALLTDQETRRVPNSPSSLRMRCRATVSLLPAGQSVRAGIVGRSNSEPTRIRRTFESCSFMYSCVRELYGYLWVSVNNTVFSYNRAV